MIKYCIGYGPIQSHYRNITKCTLILYESSPGSYRSWMTPHLPLIWEDSWGSINLGYITDPIFMDSRWLVNQCCTIYLICKRPPLICNLTLHPPGEIVQVIPTIPIEKYPFMVAMVLCLDEAPCIFLLYPIS